MEISEQTIINPKTNISNLKIEKKEENLSESIILKSKEEII